MGSYAEPTPGTETGQAAERPKGQGCGAGAQGYPPPERRARPRIPCSRLLGRDSRPLMFPQPRLSRSCRKLFLFLGTIKRRPIIDRRYQPYFTLGREILRLAEQHYLKGANVSL